MKPRFALCTVAGLLLALLQASTAQDNSSTPTAVPINPVSSTELPVTVNWTVVTQCVLQFISDYMYSRVPPTDVVNTTMVASYSQSAVVDNCTARVAVNCSTSRTDAVNSTYLYGLRCISSGLNVYRWTGSNSCNSLIHLNHTMAELCFVANNTLNCSMSSTGLYSMPKSAAVGPLLKACPLPAPTTPGLIPNPVGPEAITAIVVLVCLFITAVLAGFFFWPKCHISNPAAAAVKKMTKPPAAGAQLAAAGSVSKASSGPDPMQVLYDADKNKATIKVSASLGPSAA